MSEAAKIQIMTISDKNLAFIHTHTHTHTHSGLVTKSCPTLCHPMDSSQPGSSVHRILQARILEWVAISFSGDLPNPGIKPGSPALQGDSLPTEPPGKPIYNTHIYMKFFKSVNKATQFLKIGKYF